MQAENRFNLLASPWQQASPLCCIIRPGDIIIPLEQEALC